MIKKINPICLEYNIINCFMIINMIVSLFSKKKLYNKKIVVVSVFIFIFYFLIETFFLIYKVIVSCVIFFK